MMRRTGVALASLALAAGLTACGSSGSGGGGSTSQPPVQSTSGSSSGSSSAASSGSGQAGAAQNAVTVEVKGFAFMPGDVTVAKGGTVTWKFEDNTQHNVTANDNKFKSKDIQSGSYKYQFNTAGSYDYICTIHQYMKGTVTVK